MALLVMLCLVVCFIGCGMGICIADTTRWKVTSALCFAMAAYHLFAPSGALSKLADQESPKNLAKVEAKGWKITGEVEIDRFGYKGGKVKLVSKKDSNGEQRAILSPNGLGQWSLSSIEVKEDGVWRRITD